VSEGDQDHIFPTVLFFQQQKLKMRKGIQI